LWHDGRRSGDDVAVLYIVKWKPRGISEPVTFPRRFASVTAAIIEAACAILGKQPDDVWIENEAGVKILDAAQIAEYCHPV
jgi:hypothetical protein